jgi:hypothetical protein
MGTLELRTVSETMGISSDFAPVARAYLWQSNVSAHIRADLGATIGESMEVGKASIS